MPKPNQTVTAREMEICDRVRHLRKNVVKWSQPTMAEAIGVSLHQLAGIEYRRVPLNFGIAISLCNKCNVNQRWLALGEFPIQPRLDVLMHRYANYPATMPFSQVFDDILEESARHEKNRIIQDVGEENYRLGNFTSSDSRQAHVLTQAGADNLSPDKSLLRQRALLSDVLALHNTGSPPEALRKKLEKKLDPLLAVYLRDPKKAEWHLPVTASTGLKKEFDALSILGNISDVKAKLPRLIKRLNEATKERGTKTALAKFIGVPLPKISQWLAGEHEPGGETTLRLLQWVEQQERQK